MPTLKMACHLQVSMGGVRRTRPAFAGVCVLMLRLSLVSSSDTSCPSFPPSLQPRSSITTVEWKQGGKGMHRKGTEGFGGKVEKPGARRWLHESLRGGGRKEILLVEEFLVDILPLLKVEKVSKVAFARSVLRADHYLIFCNLFHLVTCTFAIAVHLGRSSAPPQSSTLRSSAITTAQSTQALFASSFSHVSTTEVLGQVLGLAHPLTDPVATKPIDRGTKLTNVPRSIGFVATKLRSHSQELAGVLVLIGGAICVYGRYWKWFRRDADGCLGVLIDALKASATCMWKVARANEGRNHAPLKHLGIAPSSPCTRMLNQPLMLIGGREQNMGTLASLQTFLDGEREQVDTNDIYTFWRVATTLQ